MVLTIKNFESQNVGPGVVETAPTNLVGVAGTLKATLTWTSATGESGVIWSEEKLVRKEGSAPSNSLDGTVVTTITTKDTYASTGYEDTGLDSTKTYYYKVFAVYDNGTERGSTAVDVTPLGPTPLGVYHSATLGLITIADGNGNEVTIADKNIGATTTDVTSTASYGDYFSWGALQNRNGQTATGYTMQQDWSTGTQTIAPAGFKIPTQDDWTACVNLLRDVLGLTTSQMNYNIAMQYLFLPRSGQMLDNETAPSYTETAGGGYYWTSTKDDTTKAFLLRSTVSALNSTGASITYPRGLTVRCFKNVSVAPDNTWTKLFSLGNFNTMTVVWNETTNPNDFFVEYQDDATLIPQGSKHFDNFFEYKPVLLNGTGTETAELNPNNFAQKSDGGGANITSGDNVMIKFPARGIKMSKTGTRVTLSITKELNKAGYQYYAFQNGTLSSPGAIQNALYIGAYKAYNNSNVLKSWSGKTSTNNISISDSCTYAKANGTGYNILSLYGTMYPMALYMMKYGTPNFRSKIGQGGTGRTTYTSGVTNTIGMNGKSSSNNRIKLFGLEDFRGGLTEWIGGTWANKGTDVNVQLSDYTGALWTGEALGFGLSNNVSKINIKGTNQGMFLQTGGSGNLNEGYDSNARLESSQYPMAAHGEVGLFDTTYVSIGGGTGNSGTGARLQYLPVPAPALLSYEEIKAMVQTDATGVTNAINELNSKKAEYIEKFRTENHIYQYSGSTAYLLSDDGTQGGLLLSYRGYRIAYDINMLTPMDEYFWGEINA